jgi:hypothetical protein
MRNCIECNKEIKYFTYMDGVKKDTHQRLKCSECKPFTKSGIPRKLQASGKLCSLCNLPTKGRFVRCYSCTSRIRRYRNKLAAIKLLGSKCNRCGYDKHIGALEFHHLRDKDFNIGNFTNSAWNKIKKEIEKCELICSNCHRIEHCKDRDDKFLEEVKNYKGKMF